MGDLLTSDASSGTITIPSGATITITTTAANTSWAPTSNGFAAQPAGRTGRWEALLVVEGIETGDRRFIAPGALSWRDLPLPLMAMTKNPEGGDGHAGAFLVGKIDEIIRDGNRLFGRGTIDLDSPSGAEVWRQLASGNLRGVSVDLSAPQVEVEYPEAAEEPTPGMTVPVASPLVRFTKAEIMGASITPFPAFKEAFVRILADEPVALADEAVAASANTVMPAAQFVWAAPFAPEGQLDIEESTVESLVAAAATVESVTTSPPPAAWFSAPTGEELMRMRSKMPAITVEPNGRVYGYAAAWGSCHTGFAGRCVTVPKSRCNYAKFRTGGVLTADGDTVATGRIFLGGDHAPTNRRLTEAQTVDYYAATSRAVADVAAGEDEFGIWFAGYVRPGTDPHDVIALRASDVSPDWRNVDGKGLEMLCMLSVNASGFVLPAVTASAAEDEIAWQALAAGHNPRAEVRLDAADGWVVESLVAGGQLVRRNRTGALTEEVAELRAAVDALLARSDSELAARRAELLERLGESHLIDPTAARMARRAALLDRLGVTDPQALREQRKADLLTRLDGGAL